MVKVQPVRRSSLVSLNEKICILNRIMKPMIRAEQETLEELVKVLKACLGQEKNKNIRKIISSVLFGSLVHAFKERRVKSLVELYGNYPYFTKDRLGQ